MGCISSVISPPARLNRVVTVHDSTEPLRVLGGLGRCLAGSPPRLGGIQSHRLPEPRPPNCRVRALPVRARSAAVAAVVPSAEATTEYDLQASCREIGAAWARDRPGSGLPHSNHRPAAGFTRRVVGVRSRRGRVTAQRTCRRPVRRPAGEASGTVDLEPSRLFVDPVRRSCSKTTLEGRSAVLRIESLRQHVHGNMDVSSSGPHQRPRQQQDGSSSSSLLFDYDCTGRVIAACSTARPTTVSPGRTVEEGIASRYQDDGQPCSR